MSPTLDAICKAALSLPVEERVALVERLLESLKVRLGSWTLVDVIYDRLAASARTFSDSADLLREDRGR
jgi:hypothetical protein